MDILHPKLHRISTYQCYCPNCSIHFELDDLLIFKSHYECPDCRNNAYLNTVKDKDK